MMTLNPQAMTPRAGPSNPQAMAPQAGPSSPLEDSKYKRPSGEPSKAYNLEKKLVEECGWSSEEFECIKVSGIM